MLDTSSPQLTWYAVSIPQDGSGRAKTLSCVYLGAANKCALIRHHH
jgi:hypothetical protein